MKMKKSGFKKIFPYIEKILIDIFSCF